MSWWCALLGKDFRRVGRNPLPWLINLAMPLVITALIGFAFGRGTGGDAGLGRIRFAVVDEDDSLVTRLLRGGMNQGEAAKHLEPVLLARTSALRQLEANELSAVVVIPPHFTRDYLTARAPVRLELIKNPARSLHPAVLEELLGVVVSGLNALARNAAPELAAWRTVSEGGGDFRSIADLIVQGGERFETLRRYLDPPLITYAKEVRRLEGKAGAAGPASNLFGYILAGLTAMFMLFLASTGMTDLHRELSLRTFDRYQSLRHRLFPFVAAKVLFVMLMLGVCGGIMLGGGGCLFGINWRAPVAVALLVVGYAGFAAGFMALLVALLPDERRANAWNNLIAMAMGLAGGCAFPAQALPTWLRDHVTPLLPSYWLTEGIRQLESGSASADWGKTFLYLALLTVLLLAASAALFRRRFANGLRA